MVKKFYKEGKMKLFNSSNTADKGKIITLVQPPIITREKREQAQKEGKEQADLVVNFINAYRQLKEYKDKNGETDKEQGAVKIGEVVAFEQKYDLLLAIVPVIEKKKK